MNEQIKKEENEAQNQPVQFRQAKQPSPYKTKEGEKGPIQAKQRPVNKTTPEPRRIDPFALADNPAMDAYQQQMATRYGSAQLKAATQLKPTQGGVAINNDPTLEKEADVMGAKAMQQGTTTRNEPIQKKEATPSQTGLPDQLKTGIENLSGHSMDDVKVHYNSEKPAQLQAHAYAQGTDIHLGAGQEKHLPHEAWHVVQQKQGRVSSKKGNERHTQQNKHVAQLRGEAASLRYQKDTVHYLGNNARDIQDTHGGAYASVSWKRAVQAKLGKRLVGDGILNPRQWSEWSAEAGSLITRYGGLPSGNCGEIAEVVYDWLIHYTRNQMVYRCYWGGKHGDHAFAITSENALPEESGYYEDRDGKIGREARIVHSLQSAASQVVDGWSNRAQAGGIFFDAYLNKNSMPHRAQGEASVVAIDQRQKAGARGMANGLRKWIKGFVRGEWANRDRKYDRAGRDVKDELAVRDIPGIYGEARHSPTRGRHYPPQFN